MSDIIVKCTCGQEMRVDGSARGRTGHCVNCGARLQVPDRPQAPEPGFADEADLFLDEDEALPGFEPPQTAETPRYESILAPAESSPPRAARSVQPEKCARCGKPFRGDWDRVQRGERVLCNVCAHHVEELDAHAAGTPASTAAAHEPEETGDTLKRISKELSWTLPDKSSEKNRLEADRRKRKREMTILGVIAAAVLLAILIWPSGGQHQLAEQALAEPQALPGYLSHLVTGITWFSSFAVYFLALYLSLWASNGLHNDGFIPNIPEVLPAAILIWLVGSFPYIGLFVALIVAYAFSNLGGYGMVYFIPFYFMSRILVWALRSMLLGLLGMLFT